MAHILITRDAGINPASSGDNVVISGQARCSGMTSASADIYWSLEFDPSDTAAAINDAIRDAVVAAALANDPSWVVGALDRKIIFSGAIGLL